MSNIKTGERKMINNTKLVAGESIPAARRKPSSMLMWDFSGLQLFWGQPHSLSQCQEMVAAMNADLFKDTQQDDIDWATPDHEETQHGEEHCCLSQEGEYNPTWLRTVGQNVGNDTGNTWAKAPHLFFSGTSGYSLLQVRLALWWRCQPWLQRWWAGEASGAALHRGQHQGALSNACAPAWTIPSTSWVCSSK